MAAQDQALRTNSVKRMIDKQNKTGTGAETMPRVTRW